MTVRDAAIQYARNGWNVIPLHSPQGAGCSCGHADCGKPGKHPRIAEWQRVFCDVDSAERYWTQWPDANIGLRLDDLVVLDVDVKATENGLQSWAALETEHGTLDPRARQKSGSGGWHYLFEGVNGLSKHLKFRPGLDLLTGAGCFIVVEPSAHATGGVYAWTDEPSPLAARRDTIALTAPPQWVVDAATNRKPKTAERVPADRLMVSALEKIQAGAGRNDAGLWFFCQRRDNGYSRDEAFLFMRDWVSKANEATPGHERYAMKEAEATLRSAFKREARERWDEPEREGHADILLKLTDDFEYYKSGPANDGYVRMDIGDHRELWRVDAKGTKVREVLTHRFLAQKGRAPKREALNTVVDTVAAKCGLGSKADVHVRYARNRDAVYLDMADDRWRAIEVTKDGWRVVDEPPVLFRRGAGARPLPVPTCGGTLDSLRALVNAGDDSQWCLMLAWLVGTFLPQGAFTHLALHGEQGSAKSTTALLLQSMLDPSDAGLNSPPKDEVDATVAALHAGILAYDNLSGCHFGVCNLYRSRLLIA